MTITIPTGELVSALAEAIPFAAQDKDSYWHGVHLAWDGGRLHVSAVDTLIGGRISWTPGEGAESHVSDEQAQAIPRFGGDDEPWQVFISVPSAKEIVKTYKLPAKHELVPLMLKVTPTGSSLIVERSRETGQSQHLGMWPADLDKVARFPDIVTLTDHAEHVGGKREFAAVSAYRLAAFGGLGRHGLLTMTFADASLPISVRVGDTFRGFLYESSVSPAAAQNIGSSFLRDATGVHTSASE
jgi:hypothetical protein